MHQTAAFLTPGHVAYRCKNRRPQICRLREQRVTVVTSQRAEAQPPDQQPEGNTTTTNLDADDIPRSFQAPTVDTASATAQALLDDVAANPEYYLNVTGVLLGLTLLVIVLSATVFALDSLPVVPDVLRMVGLGYLFWFLAKFLFSAEERRRLANEVDDFVAGVRGGEFKVLESRDRSEVQLMESEETA